MKIRIPLFASLICALSAHLFIAAANIGDMAVYNNAGDSSLAIASGQSVVNLYTNTVVQPVAEYQLEAGGDGVRVNSSGKHLVLYNSRIDNDNADTGRGEMITHLSLQTGSTTNALVHGWAQGFIRNQDGNDEAVVSGAAIIEAASNDILRLNSTRTDANVSLDAVIAPGHTAIQLLKLDDSLDYLRISQTSDTASMGPASFTAISWDTEVESSAGAMSFTAGSSSITLNNNGYYMVFANTYLERGTSNTRGGATGRLTLNNTQIEGTLTTTYLRGNQDGESCFDGVLCIGTIIKAVSGDVLRVEHFKEYGDNYKIKGGKTGLTIVHLPDTAQVIRLQDTTGQDLNTDAGAPVTFDTQLETPAAAFSHSTVADTSKITINTAGRYIFLGGYFDDDDGAQRICPNPQWSVNGSTIPYGETSQYSRNQNVENNGNWLGMISTLISNDYVEMTSIRLGNGGVISGDSVGLQGLDLATITTNPVLILSGPMAVTTNSTATVKARHLLTRDTDTAASSLIYTVTSPPANALVYNDGVLLTNNASFTQADINNNKITLTAEGTIGSYDVFDFSVSDGGSNPSTGTFSILASAGVMTAPDSGTLSEDAVLTLLSGGIDSVLTNDFGVGIFVSAYDSTSALGASVTMSGDGTFTYDPTASVNLQGLGNGSSTNDTFTYTVEDFAGLSGSATVTITVIGTNDTFAAQADYVNDPSITETNGASLTVNLVANDGITGTANGVAANKTLMLNYTAEYTGLSGRWYNTGYNTQSGMNWYMSSGCTPASITSSYAGLSRAFIFDGITGRGTYNEGGFSIHDITTGDPDAASATIEFWVKPDPAALTQTNTLFETGGGTGLGVIIDKGILRAACNINVGQVDYDLLSDPLALLTDDITNEFFHVAYVINFESDYNTLYINGIAVGSTYNENITDWDGGDGSGLGHFGESNHGGFQNGAAGTGYDTYYPGAMAAVRLYSAPLNAAQIYQNYQAIKDGATDIDGDSITVSGIYSSSGTLVPGTGTAVTLASGATITLNSGTGSFTYDPTGIPGIEKLWGGQTYIDTFTYQATDGNGTTSDALVEILVHGVSGKSPATVAAVEGIANEIRAGEILRGDQLETSVLAPYVALYAHPDQIDTSDRALTIWRNAGSAAHAFNATLDYSMPASTVSGFGGIGYALAGPGAALPSLDTIGLADQSWEVWFKPSWNSTGRSVILESGGNGNGTAIYFDAERNSVNVVVDGGDDTTQTMTAEIEDVRWDEFNQIIAVMEFDTPGQPDVLTVYLNNDPASPFSTAESVVVSNASGSITLAEGTDLTGIGRMVGTTARNAANGRFLGEIAHVLVYDYALSQSQAQTAYNAIRKQITSVQGGATALGASLSLSSGIVSYDASAMSTNIPYGDSAADSFTLQYTDSDGSTVNATAPVEVSGVGAVQAINDTITIIADGGSTNFNPMANDTGLSGSEVIQNNSILIADFVDDYQDGTNVNQTADFRDINGHGWQYMWNAPTNWIFGSNIYDGASGVLTDTSSYSNLVWAQTSYWMADSDNNQNNGTPANYIRLRLNGGLGDGHTGDGFSETPNEVERCVILAYTVSEDGYYSLYDSLLENITAQGDDGISVTILVNSTRILVMNLPELITASFDCDLGHLTAGDTVYVAIGGRTTNHYDSFNIDYSIVKRAAMDAQVLNITGSIVNLGSSITYSTDNQFTALGIGQSAFETFTYTVQDNGELTTATVTIEVQGVNDAPVAVNDSKSTDEDTATSDSVLNNDTDIDKGDLQTLFVSEVQGNPANVGLQTTSDMGGLLTLYSGGYYTYDHTNMFNYLAVGESATDTFSYRIEDQYGAESGEATVTITITGNDDGVVAVTNSYNLEEDETLSGNVITDNTGQGVDINIDTNDRLMISSVDTTGMLGTLSIGELQTVCIRGKVTPTGVPQTVTYDAGGGTITDPVVFVTPAGVSDPEPGSIVISNITDSSFVLVFKEQKEGGAADDGDGNIHSNTTEISYMVFNAGEYILADGTRFEVGKSEVSAMHVKNASTLDWDEVTFSTPFDAQPVVINQIQSWNDPQGELFGTRMNGGSYAGGSVTTTGFEIALEEYENSPDTPAYSETVGWIAIEKTSGTWDGNSFKAAVQTGVKAFDTAIPAAFNFGITFAEPPYLLGCLANVSGADAAVLRSGTITATTYELFMREDSVNDAELGHIDENLTYLAIDGSGDLTAYNITGGAGYFTYDPAGAVNPPPSGSIVESFSYTLRDQHGNESSATVSITVESKVDGTLIILR